MLADVEGRFLGFGKAIDDLKDAGVDAFGAGACQGGFGNDERFDALKLQRVGSGGVALKKSGGGLPGADAQGVLFVDINSDLKGIDIAEDEGGGLVLTGSVFPGADVDLQHGGVFGGANGESLNQQSGLFDIGFGGFELGAGGRDFGFRNGQVIDPVGQVILANGALVWNGLEAIEGGAGFVELGKADVELGLADCDGSVLFAQSGAQFAVIDDEQDVVLFDFVPDAHFDFVDHARRRNADGDIFAEGFDDAGGGNASRVRFCRRGDGRWGNDSVILTMDGLHDGRHDNNT